MVFRLVFVMGYKENQLQQSKEQQILDEISYLQM